MPYGSGPLIRSALVRAAPWQRYLICIAMIAGGVALVFLGSYGGAVLAVMGGLMLVQMLRFRLRRGRVAQKRAGAAPT
jgi:hypothetical protein